MTVYRITILLTRSSPRSFVCVSFSLVDAAIILSVCLSVSHSFPSFQTTPTHSLSFPVKCFISFLGHCILIFMYTFPF